MRSVEPQPNTSGRGSSFAASHKELCTQRCVRRHQGCEGYGPSQDPLSSCLATSAGYGRRRRWDGLRDFGGLAALPRPSPGVIPDSEDEQPHVSGGCRLRPAGESACLRALIKLPPGMQHSHSRGVRQTYQGSWRGRQVLTKEDKEGDRPEVQGS